VRARIVRGDVDPVATLSPMRRGAGDPTIRIGRVEVLRASRTADGAVTVRFRRAADGVEVHAWGPGARSVLEQAEGWLGLGDGTEGFDPPPGVVRDAHRRHRGLRVPSTGLVVEHLLPSVLEQKVTGIEARRAYRRLTMATSGPAPGPFGLRLPPEPARVAELPYYAMHPFGIERRRAEVLRSVCARAAWLDAAAELARPAARERIASVPGIGAWTTAEVARLALGDADAISIGDYHVPHLVAWALAGRARGTDEEMLELLEPYRPHRGLVQLLLERTGIRAPSFGPRMDVRRIERI
jgi:endonuclease III